MDIGDCSNSEPFDKWEINCNSEPRKEYEWELDTPGHVKLP